MKPRESQRKNPVPLIPPFLPRAYGFSRYFYSLERSSTAVHYVLKSTLFLKFVL